MALRLLLDANVPKALARALARRAPSLDVLRLQDTPVVDAPDPQVLEFAAQENRVLVSRDKRTLRDFAYRRVRDGKPMPGVLIVRPRYLHRQARLSAIVEELTLIAEASTSAEWDGVVQFIPTIYR